LADAVRQQFSVLHEGQMTLGAVQSVEFRGVGNQGWDIYEVKYDHGIAQWRISLEFSGIVSGAWVTAGP
jgi:hypothetical protein